MADARLYVGNRETLDWVCISKSYGTWREVYEHDAAKFNEILKTDIKGALCQPTSLVLFSDSDEEIYLDFMENGQELSVLYF